MSDVFRDFDERVSRLSAKHEKLQRGYVGQITRDGLIVFRPKRRRLSLSPRGLALVAIGFVFFKSVIVAHLGLETYSERIAALQDGTMVEQAGAFIMQPDPATQWAAAKMRPYFR